MAVRITTRHEADRQIIRIDGRLTAEGVSALEKVVDTAVASVWIELHDLRSADECGLAAIRRLQATGARLVDVPPYLQLLIEQVDEGTNREDGLR